MWVVDIQEASSVNNKLVVAMMGLKGWAEVIVVEARFGDGNAEEGVAAEVVVVVATMVI